MHIITAPISFGIASRLAIDVLAETQEESNQKIDALLDVVHRDRILYVVLMVNVPFLHPTKRGFTVQIIMRRVAVRGK